jgi:hypothetical protein
MNHATTLLQNLDTLNVQELKRLLVCLVTDAPAGEVCGAAALNVIFLAQ